MDISQSLEALAAKFEFDDASSGAPSETDEGTGADDSDASVETGADDSSTGDSDEDTDADDGEDSDDTDGDDSTGEEDADQTFEVKVNGETLTVPVSELIKSYGLAKAHTQKAQALADERRDFEASKKELTDKAEILDDMTGTWQDAPYEVTATLISQVEKPEQLLLETIFALASRGVNVDSFLNAFELTKEQAEGWWNKQEVGRNRRANDDRARREEESRKEEEARTAAYDEWQEQWDRVVDTHGLKFTGHNDEFALKVELLQFSRDNGGIPLDVAYRLIQADRTVAAAKETAKKVANPKRVSAPISKNGGAAGKAPAAPGKPSTKGSDYKLDALMRRAAELNL